MLRRSQRRQARALARSARRRARELRRNARRVARSARRRARDLRRRVRQERRDLQRALNASNALPDSRGFNPWHGTPGYYLNASHSGFYTSQQQRASWTPFTIVFSNWSGSSDAATRARSRSNHGYSSSDDEDDADLDEWDDEEDEPDDWEDDDPEDWEDEDPDTWDGDDPDDEEEDDWWCDDPVTTTADSGVFGTDSDASDEESSGLVDYFDVPGYSTIRFRFVQEYDVDPDTDEEGDPGPLPVEEIRQLPVRIASGTESNSPCNICCQDFQLGESVKTVPCFHEFHQCCLDKWLVIKQTCPTCRSVVKI